MQTRTIIDDSISSLFFIRQKTMAIRFSDKFFPLYPRFVALSRVVWLGDRYAVKIYRGKLKCHGIIARSEAIKIPDSKPETIEPCDITRPDYCHSEPLKSPYRNLRNYNRLIDYIWPNFHFLVLTFYRSFQ